jgi:hypothetical protein
VTRREEPLPIAVSVLGAPGRLIVLGNGKIFQHCGIGMDLILADIVEKGMQDAGLPRKVKTGRSMY